MSSSTRTPSPEGLQSLPSSEASRQAVLEPNSDSANDQVVLIALQIFVCRVPQKEGTKMDVLQLIVDEDVSDFTMSWWD